MSRTTHQHSGFASRFTALCLLAIFMVTSDALRFGMPSRLFSQTVSPNVIKSPTPERTLESITVDNSRQLMDISDSNFKQNVLNQEGLTVVLFTRFEKLQS